ncbi:MAG: GGDEF domain-containing protein [Burkholderiales bacterium]|nr:GGDEF domain-containing protein [Burkholderiales bacterium]
MLDVIATGLVAVGAVLLMMALVPAGQIIGELPGGTVRRHWQVLAAFMYLFVAAFVWYLVSDRPEAGSVADLLVPGAFFLGGYFVLLVTLVSLQTARDVKRIAALEEQSITDPLTGLYNRRHLDRRLEEEVGKSVRYGIPLSVLLLDVDHFKSVNDRLGHAVGDRVLIALARLMLQAARKSDFVTRYGGEEILLLAPHTALADACLLADRLRRSVESLPIAPADAPAAGAPIKVTVSIGVAALGPEVPDGPALLKMADDALYRAKHGGRNRVEVAKPAAPVREHAAAAR